MWNQRLNYDIRTMTQYHIEKCPHRLSVRLGMSRVQDSCLSALGLAQFLLFLLQLPTVTANVLAAQQPKMRTNCLELPRLYSCAF